MKKPIIGIVARTCEDLGKPFLGMNEECRLAIVKAGGIPLLIAPPNQTKYESLEDGNFEPLTLEEREDYGRILSLCDGFLSPGGDQFYDFDCLVCQYAYENDLPYLGICLGMQVLGHLDSFLKGDFRDQTILNHTAIDHYQPEKSLVHKNKIFQSQLFDILEVKKLIVNSRHHSHIDEKNFFKVSSRSIDGLIEGIELPNRKFMIGVQWHPESMVSECREMLKLFESFVQACN